MDGLENTAKSRVSATSGLQMRRSGPRRQITNSLKTQYHRRRDLRRIPLRKTKTINQCLRLKRKLNANCLNKSRKLCIPFRSFAPPPHPSSDTVKMLKSGRAYQTKGLNARHLEAVAKIRTTTAVNHQKTRDKTGAIPISSQNSRALKLDYHRLTI